jgi:hypothetical protein
MRAVALLTAAAFLLLPAIQPAAAHHSSKSGHADLSLSSAKKKAKGKAKRTKPKKEEYLRAVPSR